MPNIEILGKAIPKIPSNLEAINDAPDNVVASPNSTPLTYMPLNDTSSLETKAFILPLP